jgi:serine/threonine protein kinase
MHFAMELLRLLDGLHSARIVHSDIKPDNLLVHVRDTGAGKWGGGGESRWGTCCCCKQRRPLNVCCVPKKSVAI